jgi:hypothetical protein
MAHPNGGVVPKSGFARFLASFDFRLFQQYPPEAAARRKSGCRVLQIDLVFRIPAATKRRAGYQGRHTVVERVGSRIEAAALLPGIDSVGILEELFSQCWACRCTSSRVWPTEN